MNPTSPVIESTLQTNGAGAPPSAVPTVFEEWLRKPTAPRFVLRGLNWADYKAIAEKFLAHRHLHLTYDRGTLELMTTSSTHGAQSRLICLLIIALAEEMSLPVAPCGDMTCEHEEADHALQPDECFYLTHQAQVEPRERIDLT